jgi:hypothetical protein
MPVPVRDALRPATTTTPYGAPPIPWAGRVEFASGIGPPTLALATLATPESRVVGDDSRFFALLGSAPQELNTVRPEAKLTC